MHSRKLLAVGAIMCLMLMGYAVARDDKKPADSKPADAPKMPDMAEMMRKWKESITPGPNHKKLDHFVGSWNVTFKTWMDPSMPPMETKGTAEVKWVLDGCYIMEEMTAEMLMPDEKMQMNKVPYKGIGFTGYDNAKNLYTSVWASNLSTELLTMSGTMQPDGKTLVAYGKMDEPMMNMFGRTVKYKTVIKDDKTHTFEIFDLAAGENHKVIEIVYQRK